MSSNKRKPLIGVTGSRSGSDLELVRRAIAAAVRGGKHIAVGCAKGVDQAAIDTATTINPRALTIFSVFGLDSTGKTVGHWRGSAVASVTHAKRAGAKVQWWAGWADSANRQDWWANTNQAPTISLAARLAKRSTLMVHHVNQGGPGRTPGSAIIGFPSNPKPKGLRPTKRWPSGYGSGTWSTLALAAGLRIPIIVFPNEYDLPEWQGEWVQVLSDPKSIWSLAYRWRSPELCTLEKVT